MPKTRLVLCIRQDAINSFDNLDATKLAFIDRSIVDNKDDLTIGKLFPQIIPVILVQNEEGKFLTYARNGNETRLHGSRSLLIGGHIDIEDVSLGDLKHTIVKSALRELEEEIGLTTNDFDFVYDGYTPYERIIYSNKDEVSQVHVGLLASITVDTSKVKPSDEIYDVSWLSQAELSEQLDQYEEWSQIVINQL